MGYPVLVHGFTGSGESWDGVVDGLTAAGQIPVRVDLPGHGARASEVPTIEGALATIDSAGDWPTALIGYSMGGRVALHYAVREPGRVERLVLESASPGLASPEERSRRVSADRELATRIEAEGVPAFVDGWERLPLFESQGRLDPERLARQRELRLRSKASGLAGALRGLGTGALPSLWDELLALSVPTLILVGELDRKFVDIGERMVDRLPRATLRVVPDCGHTVHLERPRAWIEAVADFLG